MHLKLAIGLSMLASTALGAEPVSACSGSDPLVVRLQADDLRVNGFDAINGMVAVSVARRLESCPGRPRALTIHRGRNLLVPVPATDIPLLLEAQREGGLRGTVELRRWSEAGCDDFVPSSICLAIRGADLPVACRDLDKAPETRPVVELDVRVGPPHSENGEHELPSKRLRDQARFVGQECLREVLGHVHAVRGAMSIQLTTSPLGRPQRPRVVVDGLVNRPLSHCLVKRLFEDPTVWKGLPDGARLYLPFYFRGARLPKRRPSTPSLLPVDWNAP